jgi:hypothetical protein
MYGLFNNRTFTVVSIIFIVTNPYCVTGFDIIQAYHQAYSYDLLHLDLTLLYADWTLSRINSLTRSHLVVLILFYRRWC